MKQTSMIRPITVGQMLQLYDEQVKILSHFSYNPTTTISLEQAWIEFQSFTPYLYVYNQLRNIRFFPFAYVSSGDSMYNPSSLILPDYAKNEMGEYIIQFGYTPADELHPCDWWGMFLSIMYQDFPPSYRHIHTIQDTSIRRLIHIHRMIPECEWIHMIICHHTKSMIGWGWLYIVSRSRMLQSSVMIQTSVLQMYPKSVSMQSLLMNGIYTKLISHFWFSQIFTDLKMVYGIHFQVSADTSIVQI